jgi:hypothetical protein
MPFLAVAAIAGGAAVATGAVAASTMLYVGMAATVVGKLTKSKELAQIGAGLSLGTSIAGLAGGLFGTADTGKAIIDGAEAAATGAGASGAAGAADAAGFMEGATAQADSWVQAASASVAPTQGLSSASSGLLNSTPQNFASAPSTFTNFNTDVTQMGQAAENAGMATDVASALKAAPIAAPGGTDPGTLASWWSKLPETTKNTILQTGGNMASKLFEGWSQEEIMAFQREKFNLEQMKYSQSVANANAQPTIARPSGLLNATRG